MPEFILHHYPLSPFSEKIRAMLGYAGLSWCSVVTAEMPPRPMLVPLAGGYRKIPVAQLGADVFCDTRTITREIARLAGKPELSMEGVSEEVRDFVRETDLTVFFACIMSSMGLKVNIKLFRALSLMQFLRFFRDRIQMGRTSAVPRMGLKQARQRVREHLADLDRRLASSLWLFGEQPCIADFTAYHSLWFLRDVAESPMLEGYPRVMAWMDRIKAFGHGESVEITPEVALDMAKTSEPRPLGTGHAVNAQPFQEGQAVSVVPTDYGQVPTTGGFRRADDQGYVLELSNAGGTMVHVHFPAEGFQITHG